MAGVACAVLAAVVDSSGVAPPSPRFPAPSPPHSPIASAGELESALVEGRYRDARRLLGPAAQPGRSLAPGEATLVARAAIEMRDWERATALEPDATPEGDRDSAWFAWGLAHARLAWPGARRDHTTRARRAAAVLDEAASRQGRSTRTEVRHLAVRAAVAAAEEERDEMAVILARARIVDDLLVQAGLGADPVVALPELEGDLWLQVSRFRDAVEAYRRVVAQPGPGRPRAWLGLARAHARLDETDAARAAAREAAALWHRADPDLPELAELRVLLLGPAAPRPRLEAGSSGPHGNSGISLAPDRPGGSGPAGSAWPSGNVDVNRPAGPVGSGRRQSLSRSFTPGGGAAHASAAPNQARRRLASAS